MAYMVGSMTHVCVCINGLMQQLNDQPQGV